MFFTIKTKLWLYETYVEPVIQYVVLIYGTSAKTDLKTIDWLQNRIIPTLFSNRKSDCEGYEFDQTLLSQKNTCI